MRRFQIVPHSVRVLRSLKAGERYVFYRGNFELDIRRCDPRVVARQESAAPAYANVLKEVLAVALDLRKRHQITLTKRYTPIPMARTINGPPAFVNCTEYIAEGIDGSEPAQVG